MADERRVVKTDNQNVGENDTDINERRIFVGGIDAGITENDLQNYFAQYGEIDYVDIKRDHNTGHVRGFCFVIFQNADSVQKAIEACDQHTIKGVEISVVKAISRRDPFPETERISNDDRKIFVGGLTDGIAEKELRTHFCQYGDVQTLDIKIRYNGQQRGFAFVGFGQIESVGKALSDCPHVINGEELCVVKAKNRSAKIFVGGFTSEISYDDIKTHFSKFGIISDISIPIDKETNQRKSYCFITFDSEQNAREALRTTNQTICGVEVGVRTAIEKGDDGLRIVGPPNNAPGLLGPPPVFGVQRDFAGSRRFDRLRDFGGSRGFDGLRDSGGSRGFDNGLRYSGESSGFDGLRDSGGSRGSDGLRDSGESRGFGGSRGFHGSINVYTAPNCNAGFGRERSDRSNWRDRESQLNWRYPDRKKGESTSWRSNNPAHK